jgi:hypothetical protein
VINQGLKEMMATQTWQANERKIAAAELRRQAKAARHTDDSPDHAPAPRLSRGFDFASVAGAYRSLRRGLVGVVVRRAPA